MEVPEVASCASVVHGSPSPALDLVWGSCNVYLVTPDVYLHLLWNLALQVIPRPTPASEIIRSMARRGRALTAFDLQQLRGTMDKQAERRCC